MRYVSALGIAIALSAFCPPSSFGQSISNLSIAPADSSYQELSETRYTRTQFYYTYKVVIQNSGPVAFPGVTATVSSSASNVQIIPGQNTVHFTNVPAHGQAVSTDSFTILVDRSVTFDWTQIQWSFQNPVANPGPNQTTTVNSTVTLNASGSTNPSGIGSLTYSWVLQSAPAGSRAALSNANMMIATFVPDTGGTYTIQLTVSNGAGTDSAIITVSTVNSQPVANAGPNQTVALGSLVKLDGSKSYDTDGDPLTYTWSFISIPTGSSATLSNLRSVNPTFIADVHGTYALQLVVNDGIVNSVPSTVTISTGNTPPVANAGPNQKVNIGALVQLNGSGSTDVDGNPLTYRWSLNITQAPGSNATLTNPNSVNPTFTADVAGTYVAQLIVNDGIVDSQPATVTISTNSVQAPTANAGPNQTVVHGSTVTLNGSGSSDPQGLPLTYTWSLSTRPQNSTAVLSATNIPNPTFVADQPGTYVAQLSVSNGTLSSTTPSTVTITTTNTAPIANAGANQSVFVGTTVNLDGSQSYDPDKDPITYSWTFSHIPAASNAALTGATGKTPSFVADVAGTYIVQLIVSDPFTSSVPTTVTITAGAMTLSLSPSPLNLSNSPVTVSLTVTPATGNSPVTVNLSGYDSTVISLVSTSVTVPANSTGVNFTVTPLQSGSTQLIATLPGYQPATDTVNVTTPVISVALANNATAIGLTRSIGGTITLGAPAPAGGTVVTLSADLAATGQVGFTPNTVSIAQGSTTGAFTLTGVALGSTTITASSPGYVSGTDGILVVSLGGIAVAQGVAVGLGQSTPLNVQLSTPAPVGGVTVTLTSFDTTILTVSPTVFIPQGSMTPTTPAQVTGVAYGSTSVAASAGGYSRDAETVLVAAIINFSPQAVTVGAGGVQNVNVLLSAPAPPGGLLVSLSSNRTNVATVPSSVMITGQSATIPVTAVAFGTATITASTTNQFFSAGQGLAVTVTNGPALTCPAVTSGEVGVALNSPALTVTGGATPYIFSIASGTLPAGLTLNTSTGAITGTPTASGTFAIQVKDSNGAAGSTTCPFTIAVAPALTCPAVTSGEVNVALNSPAMTVTGGVSPFTFSVSNGTLPTGLSLNTTTGAITGTPTVGGTFTIQVKDSNGVAATATCPFTIAAAPSLTCPAVTSGEVNVALNSPAMTVTGGVSPFTFSVSSGTLPAGLTLNTTTGAITGTPTVAGSFTIQVKDSNGVAATTTCPFTIAAAPSLTCPAVTSGEVGVPLNSPAMTVNGGTAPYTFSVSSGTLPAGLTLNTTTGAITGTPTAAGSFTIQVKDTNGAVASTTCPFTIAGGPVLTCPAVSSGEVGIALNSPAMTVTGGTAPYTFSVSSGTLPTGLTLNTTTGAITGTPTVAGSFTIQVKDTNGIAAATSCPFTIAAAPSLTCPAVTSGEVGAALNSPAMTVTGGVSPFTFSVSSGTLPAGLTLNTTTGAITGTPTATGNFTIQVKDSNGVAATTTCSFTIAAVPSLTCPAVSSGEVGAVLNSPAMTVTGGTAPYTFSVSSGTLPAGLTLNTTTGAITGTPTASGNFTIQVKDAKGVAATTTCPFTIAGGPSLTCPAVSSGEVNVPLNSPAMTVTGGTAPYTFSVSSGTLPAGLTLNTTTGAITGTPTASGTFTIQVKDANGVAAATTCPFTINGGPSLTCPAVSSGEVGAALNSPAMTVTGGVAPYTFSVSSGTLPAGLTLNTTTGAITGTPTVTGSFTIQVKDSNGVAAATTCPFTISTGPSLTCPAVSSGEVNVALNSPAMTVTGGVAPYTFSISSGTLPAGLTLNTTTGAITGTPTVTGSFTIQVKDSNGVAATATCPFTIAGPPALTCPAVSSGEVNVPLNSPAMTVTGGVAPYTFSISSGTLPAGLTLNTTTGAITGTATVGGNFTIQVKDANGVAATATCPFTIVTAPSLTCPAVTSGEVNVPLNSPAMTVTGGIAPYTFSLSSGTLPAGLTLNTTTGAITGTPTVSGNFTIQVKDAGGVAAVSTCPFTIATAPSLTCPAVNSGEVSVALNIPAMTVTGGVAPYTFAVSSGSLPAGLSLNTTTGAITGTATATGTFTIQVKDTNGVAATTTCPFTITAAPSLTCPAVTSGEVGLALNSPAMTVTGGTAPYTFSLSRGTLPAGLTLNTTTGAITGTPTAGGTFTVQVTDVKGAVAATSCPFTIATAPSLTCPAVSSFVVGTPVNSPAMTVTGGVAPYSFSMSSGTLPAGLTLNTTTGAITGTPTAGGSFSIQVKDSNAVVATTTCPFTVGTATLTITTTALPNGAPGTAYNFTPSITGGTPPFTWTITGLPSSLSYSSSTGQIFGSPRSAATFSLTLSVTDSTSGTPQTASKTLTLNIVSPPLSFTTTSPLPNATIGVQYVAQITANGGTLPYNWSATNLPTWLTFDQTGSICGMATSVCGTPITIGTSNFTITVFDSSSPTAQTISQNFAVLVTQLGGVGSMTVQSATVGQGLQVPITITFNPAPQFGTTQCVSPTDPGCLTLTASGGGVLLGQSADAGTPLIQGVPISTGTSSISIYVKAYGAPGSTATVTASFAGYTTASATITIANSGFVLSGPNGIGGAFNTFQVDSTTLTVYSARLDSSGLFVEQEPIIGGSSINVPIATSPTSIGTVSPSPVLFPGGTSSASVTFTASSTNSGPVSVLLTQPTGFTTPTIGSSINVTVQPSGLIAPTVVLGQNLQTNAHISLNGNAPNDIFVTVTSSDTTKLQFGCIVISSACSQSGTSTVTVKIPQNQTQSSDFYFRGYASSGSASYTISATNYGTVPATVQLVPSALVIQSPTGYGLGFSMSLSAGVDATLNIYTAAVTSSGAVLEPVASDQSVSAAVTSSNTSVGTITTSPVAISGGSSFGSTTFHPVGTGTSTITAAATGYQSGFVNGVVQGGTLSIANFVTVGQNLEAQANVILSAVAPAAGEKVTLSSQSSSVLLAVNPTDPGSTSITVTVPAGSQIATYYIYGAGSSGTGKYGASSPDFGSGTDTVFLAPSGIVIFGPNFCSACTVTLAGGPQSLTVYTAQLSTDGLNTPVTPQNLAGSAPLNVAVGDSNRGAGTLPSGSINITPGTSSTAVVFTPVAAGNTTISVTQPGGAWVVPSKNTQLAITVQ